MPVAMALLRDVHNLCPKEVLTFILDLIKYNDNRKNKVKIAFKCWSCRFMIILLSGQMATTRQIIVSAFLPPPPPPL